MKALLVLTSFLSLNLLSDVEFDFGKEQNGQDWGIINDGVMGGKSKGFVNFTDSSMVFSGRVSLENNGGFTSVKSPYQNFEMAKAKKMEIKYRLSGQEISVYLENAYGFRAPYLKYKVPESQEWTVLEVELNQFEEYYFGRLTGNAFSYDFLKEVKYIGFITSTKKASDFQMEVDYLRFE